MADHVCRCVMLPGVGTPRAYVTLVFAGCRIESENGLLPTFRPFTQRARENEAGWRRVAEGRGERLATDEARGGGGEKKRERGREKKEGKKKERKERGGKKRVEKRGKKKNRTKGKEERGKSVEKGKKQDAGGRRQAAVPLSAATRRKRVFCGETPSVR